MATGGSGDHPGRLGQIGLRYHSLARVADVILKFNINPQQHFYVSCAD